VEEHADGRKITWTCGQKNTGKSKVFVPFLMEKYDALSIDPTARTDMLLLITKHYAKSAKFRENPIICINLEAAAGHLARDARFFRFLEQMLDDFPTKMGTHRWRERYPHVLVFANVEPTPPRSCIDPDRFKDKVRWIDPITHDFKSAKYVVEYLEKEKEADNAQAAAALAACETGDAPAHFLARVEQANGGGSSSRSRCRASFDDPKNHVRLRRACTLAP